jgi:GDP-L-fucose synthase
MRWPWESLFMEKNAKIYIAGHRGLVGGAIVRKLQAEGYTNLLTRTRRELDLTDQAAVNDFFEREKPEYIFLAAAKVGGIGANSAYPADFIYQNTMIGFNVVHAAYKNKVKKLINLGSSCIYPKLAPQPLKEEYLLTDLLEPTNEAYAVAKISVIKLCAYYNRQYGTDFLSAMPTNLYGPGDNYDPAGSHVLPALIRTFHEAKVSGSALVTLWGDGTPLREFLYSDDLAEALVMLMKNYRARDLASEAGDFVNIGSGKELSIGELAELIRGIVYEGCANPICQIQWDTAKPNGTLRKLLDSGRIRSLGFSPSIDLAEGIKRAYKDFTSAGT